MSSTRREFLRDASLLTLGSAVAARTMSSQVGPVMPCQLSYTTGVRVFFGGGWLFCADPTSMDSMLAITFDPHHEPHIFPAGPWKEPPPGAPQGWWNRHGATMDLSENTQLTPHVIEILGGGLKKPASPNSLTSLFDHANNETSFTYITSVNGVGGPQYTVTNSSNLKLRVVRVPVPISIIPITYRMDATILDPGNLFQNLKPHGVATMFIFQYPEGTGLKIDGKSQFASGASQPMDFHCHVLPKNPNPPADHSAEMFADLLGLISPNLKGASLVIKGQEETVWGPCKPAKVSRAEADQPEMPHGAQAKGGAPEVHRLTMGDLASCCSGSVGLGN